MKKKSSDKYLEQARLLDKESAERLLSRMRAKLLRRFEDRKMTELEAVAMQLEIEEEDLAEWRKRVAELQKKN